MKKYSLYTLLIMLVAFTACEDYDDIDNTIYEGEDFVFFEQSSIDIQESTEHTDALGNTQIIPVSVGVEFFRATGKIDAPLTINFSVSGKYSDTGADATDAFTVSNDNQVTIPAGEVKAVINVSTVNNDVLDGVKEVVITMTGASDNSLNIGYPGPNTSGASITVVIADDDCEVPSIAGSWNVTTTNTSPAGCEGVTNTVEITEVSPGVFDITDVTGGLYVNCYGSADNPGSITTDGFNIALVDQPDIVYGGDIFNGSGKISCDGTFTLSWSNGFGDQGISLFE